MIRYEHGEEVFYGFFTDFVTVTFSQDSDFYTKQRVFVRLNGLHYVLKVKTFKYDCTISLQKNASDTIPIYDDTISFWKNASHTVPIFEKKNKLCGLVLLIFLF